MNKFVFFILILTIFQATPSLMLAIGSLERGSEDNLLQSSQDGMEVLEKRTKTKLRVHLFSKEILKQFEWNLMKHPFTPGGGDSSVSLKFNDDDAFTRREDRLFHAWLPVQVTGMDSANVSLIRFQQTSPSDSFGKFTSVLITFTLNDNVPLNPETHLKMTYIDEQHNVSPTLELWKGRKFYSFDITNFVSRRLLLTLSGPNFIEFGISLHNANGESINREQFDQLFDVQVELPLITFLYGNFYPTDATTKIPKRKRRSSGTSFGPKARCQRRTFSVPPAEVGWNNVVGPAMIDLGYCSGSCPCPLESHYYNFTRHSFLLERYRNRHAFAPKDMHSKCVPLKYKPVSIFTSNDSDHVDATIVQNISVDTCGCR